MKFGVAFLLLSISGIALYFGDQFNQNLQAAPETTKPKVSDESFLWLENIQGQKAIDWVKSQNKATVTKLEADPRYKKFHKVALELLTAKDKIPHGSIMGNYIYNHWQDKDHVRGLWRRQLIQDYKAQKDVWETVLDIDQYAKTTGENIVFKGANCLPPEYRHCLLHLSDGGKDAKTVREFDAQSKSFVKGGFELPEAKSSTDWFDKDTLVIGTDFGKGSMTDSGYPRIVKVWKRGTPLAEAKEIFAGKAKDVWVSPYVIHRPSETWFLISQGTTFYTNHSYLVQKDKPVRLPTPDHADIHGVFKGQVIFSIRKAWQGHAEGSLLSWAITPKISDMSPSSITAIFRPNQSVHLKAVRILGDRIAVSFLNEVKGQAGYYQQNKGQFQLTPYSLPSTGRISLGASSVEKNLLFATYQDFLTPPTLYDLSHGKAPKKIRSLPSRFDSTPYKISQRHAVSKDGTKVPYFLVHRKDLKLNGQNPTLLYGYGGFEIPMLPRYMGITGNVWLNEGGVYVLSNIRGGGEFGPKWHQAALKENRQKAYDDFFAIAEDLITQKITSPQNLGIMGGSNGGLLMGVALTQRPDLFNAVVCAVPLLDMLRYHKLLAGASWVAEYGNPDLPEERQFIERYSPFQNLKASVKYPEVFFVTSTRDDRVHPGHARKMAAKMQALGHPTFYFENMEGGHSASANQNQRARMIALEYVYLLNKLPGQGVSH